MRFRSVASLVLVALIAGAIAAHADSASSSRRAPAPVRVVAAPAASRPFVIRAPLPLACAAPMPVAPGGKPQPPQPPKAATAAPPSQQLLDAFAILRRPRTDQDALSPEALEALRARPVARVARLVAPAAQHAVGRQGVGRPGPERRRPVRCALRPRRQVRCAR